ncbi:hypothetical protein TVAG_038850 [Trichomonas vaginalis G3]|uniref:Prenyltransferase alpha-alpha toroid domain-containing protein n=1 Tax=Trichomonas vaginalis (strain ATCC PRA-98 / G3) TaxID=412133 RepID=A2E5J8_TRIV3|nr:hypothetical protein TVAGG3_0240290 [Trichomonas vaginalis G3]EAY12039.1 hypothetical protein TVAG_038850 [Trichomonas vaginalis G3]KAI5553277.1 hypothetical protein TVAGG3_0240290 [Trichomonas vaginalis G3]|eukprot:XP_001324262.1 hypothetical protein [Trichomonas vaginalis G3]
MFLFAALSRSANSGIDQYLLGKRLAELGLKQHANGGFFEVAGQEPTAELTYHAIYLGFTYGLFKNMDFSNAQRFVTSLRNRDGGAGMSPGQKSSVEATYYYFKAATIILPNALDIPSVVEFLKNHYDSNSGLFRDTLDSDPTVRATHFAYLTLNKLENELTWLNTFAIRNYITDHTQDDRFSFDGIDEINAQIYGTAISRAISLQSNNYRADQYSKKLISDGIKAKNITLYQIGNLLNALNQEGSSDVPEELKNPDIPETINDLFSLTRLLVSQGIFEKLLDIELFAITTDNQVLELGRGGLTLGQVVRPAAVARILKRFVNPYLAINLTTTIGEEKSVDTKLDFDERNGVWMGDRYTQATKLGQLTFDIQTWLPIREGHQVDVTKNIQTSVSLPVDISCDVTASAEEIIPVGGIIEPGAAVKSVLHGRFEDGIEVEEGTMATFAVYDSSEALLFYDSADFKLDHTFQWIFDPKNPIPDGYVKFSVEIGDRQHDIHTRKEFRYLYHANMTVISHKINSTPKLGELLKVSMVPGVIVDGAVEQFNDEKSFGEDLKDASTEGFFPSGPAEAQKYQMVLKCGNAIAKTVDGEIKVVEHNITVEFETTVDENIDLATGFNIEFVFKNSEGFTVPLSLQEPIAVTLNSEIIAEQVKGLEKPQKLTYGQTIKAELVVKEKNVGKTLLPGLAFPVILLKKGDRVVAEQTATCDQKGLESVEFTIDASVPSGKLTAEIVVRKGEEYLPLEFNEKKLTQEYEIEGQIVFDHKIVQTSDAITIDYTTMFNNKAITGGFFVAKVMTPDGQVAANLPAAQTLSKSRISIPTQFLRGEYTVDLYRIGETTPVVSTKVAVQSKVVTWFSQLPIETLVVIAAFALFCWTVHLRTQFRIRNI